MVERGLAGSALPACLPARGIAPFGARGDSAAQQLTGKARQTNNGTGVGDVAAALTALFGDKKNPTILRCALGLDESTLR